MPLEDMKTFAEREEQIAAIRKETQRIEQRIAELGQGRKRRAESLLRSSSAAERPILRMAYSIGHLEGVLQRKARNMLRTRLVQQCTKKRRMHSRLVLTLLARCVESASERVSLRPAFQRFRKTLK